jgi:nicotinamidase/pyrazinamidase
MGEEIMPQRINFFDVDTQLDFLAPAGSLYVPGAEKLVPNLAALTRYAASNKYALISTTDAHVEDDIEFRTWPAHCVAGTFGQQKVAVTRLSPSVTLSSESGTFANVSAQLATAQQYVIEKQALDAFTNPNLLPLLHHLDADCYVVYGVVTELCVDKALAGLVKLGKHVVLVMDAIQGLSEAADRVVNEYRRAGVELRTTSEILAGRF